MHVTQAALPFLRQQGSGHILNVTSIAGFAAAAASGFYAASKFAVEGFSISLQQELAPLGIRVTLVEPAPSAPTTATTIPFATRPKRSMLMRSTVLGAVAQMAGEQIGDPELAAAAFLRVVDAPEAPMHLFLGPDAYQRAQARIVQQCGGYHAVPSAPAQCLRVYARQMDLPCLSAGGGDVSHVR